MNQRFNVQHITLALLGTLILAGLFYLPYLWVRNKTIDAFHAQQVPLAQQVTSDIQSYFTTYEKALEYLARQPSIQELDAGGQALLRDFFAIHTFPAVSSGVRRWRRTRCTGLSTSCVDKDEIP